METKERFYLATQNTVRSCARTGQSWIHGKSSGVLCIALLQNNVSG